jgi:hypothetical protein
MELTKHSNHRNAKYLSWLRKQNCVISGTKAQCAHHIRLGTNGGSSLKPSDYFCIPLLNEHHTTGPQALHMIGEDTFLTEYKLDKVQLFIGFLKQFLVDEFHTELKKVDTDPEALLASLISEVENNTPKSERAKKPKKKVDQTEFQIQAKEAKRASDKELRDRLKKQKPKVKASSLKGNEFYEKAKEAKRISDKDLRDKLKKKTKKSSSETSKSELDYKAKQKELMSKYRKEQYQKSKEMRAKKK